MTTIIKKANALNTEFAAFNIDFSALANRLSSKRGVREIEHCLTEILAAVERDSSKYWEVRKELFKNMKDAENGDDFYALHKQYSEKTNDFISRHSSNSTLGRLVHDFLQKLTRFEDKQIDEKKLDDVMHARELAESVVRELERVCDAVFNNNDEAVKIMENFNQKTRGISLTECLNAYIVEDDREGIDHSKHFLKINPFARELAEAHVEERKAIDTQVLKLLKWEF